MFHLDTDASVLVLKLVELVSSVGYLGSQQASALSSMPTFNGLVCHVYSLMF